MPIEIVPAGPDRIAPVSAMLGRAFEDDPMIRWKLRPDVGATEIARTFEGVVRAHAEMGTLLEVAGGHAAAGWLSPEHMPRFDDLIVRYARERLDGLTDDGGARYDAFWTWMGERMSGDRGWYLDVVGVEPSEQGRGLGAALVRLGLSRARAEGRTASLATETPGNVAFYERLGFRVSDATDAPGGGPHIWFMRAEP